MIDQSGSMELKKLSPELQARVDEMLKYIKDESNEDLVKIKKLKSFEELPEKEFIEKFPERPLRKSFKNSADLGKIKKFFKDYDLLEEIKLSPEERAARARARGEALAVACHEGTAAATTVLRPLSFRRGFISLS